MIFEEVREMLRRARDAEHVVIVGAGKTLTNLMALLRNEGISIDAVMDNNDALVGRVFDGVPVEKPNKHIGNALYIIDVKAADLAKELCDQLVGLGIALESIVFQPHAVVPKDIVIEDSENAKKVLDDLYFERFGRCINWDSPRTYNEIINYEKVFERDPRKRELADKYRVREYVKNKIGDRFLTKLYGVWSNPEDISIEKLPDQFVLKTNNGSSRNIIVTDKQQFHFDEAKEKLRAWMQSDYWKGLLEYQYKDIPPMIMCEEYLPGVAEEFGEYKFYCFHGQVEYIGYEVASHRPGWSASMYDKNWVRQNFSYATPTSAFSQSKPDNLKEMIRLSETLAEGFKHVRVDLYDLIDGRILFGEMTFSSWGGMKHFVPEKWDEIFGNLINQQ